MEFVTEHLNKLRELGHDRQSWVGGKLRPYAESVVGALENCTPSQLSSDEGDRDYLFGLIADRNVSTATCCVAILGWGGMRRDHARKVLSTAQHWMPIVDTIRQGSLTRTEAYGQFMKVRALGNLPGMGPAFFTKLIYFFGKNSQSRGYIMDQWTARSANLLLGADLVELIHTKSGSWVTDENTEAVYDSFCVFIERLAAELNVATDIAEEMIFSIGQRGRSKLRGAWRQYVLQHG